MQIQIVSFLTESRLDLQRTFKLQLKVPDVTFYYRYMCVCKCIRNWPLPIGVFQDQCKQTMINKHSNKHNQVKNPNWRQADQLAIYKRSREDELGASENNISWDF